MIYYDSEWCNYRYLGLFLGFYWWVVFEERVGFDWFEVKYGCVLWLVFFLVFIVFVLFVVEILWMGKLMEEKIFYYIKIGKLYCVWLFFKKYELFYLIGFVDCKGRIFLYVCCFFGDDVIMRLLLKKGVNVWV